MIVIVFDAGCTSKVVFTFHAVQFTQFTRGCDKIYSVYYQVFKMYVRKLNSKECPTAWL